MIYVFCPNCKHVNEATLISSLLKSDSNVACVNCGKKVKQRLFKKTCATCGNILYYPSGLENSQLPCSDQHIREAREKELVDARDEAERRATQLAAETAELEHQLATKQQLENEDEIVRLMREIPCESCPSQMLRINKGRFPACPNCGNEPSKKYIESRWKKLTGKTPEAISWDDTSGTLLVHEHQNKALIPPLSVLVVNADQIVVYDNDGNRTLFTSGVYPVFKDTQTEEEKIFAVNSLTEEEGVLSLGLRTKITFFRKEFRLNETIDFSFEQNPWTISIPIILDMRLDENDLTRIMSYFSDRTRDETLTETLKAEILIEVTDVILRILRNRSRNESTLEICSINDVKDWIDDVFSDNSRRDITDELNDSLIEQYGLFLRHPIRVLVSRIVAINTNETIEVACPATMNDGVKCNHRNQISKNDYQSHKSFVCKCCGKTITWCASCRAYVTTERIPKVCDPMCHRIYQ